jgi:hypothetical protein
MVTLSTTYCEREPTMATQSNNRAVIGFIVRNSEVYVGDRQGKTYTVLSTQAYVFSDYFDAWQAIRIQKSKGWTTQTIRQEW